jgi:glutathione S-transferase
MLTLHHLNDSRSQRILWLLEELGTPYEMKRYQRDAQTRLAPPLAVHPLGKSPVITDGDVRIVSPPLSSVLIAATARGRDAGPRRQEYKAYCSGCITRGLGDAAADAEPLCLPAEGAGAPLHPRIESAVANHLGYIEGALGVASSSSGRRWRAPTSR